MDKITLKPIGNGYEIYGKGCYFRVEGYYVVDKVELVPNNPVNDKQLVAVVHAHLREDKNVRISCTSDKFTFNAP